MTDTLTPLSQRNEVFWIGSALLLLGVITPENFTPGGGPLSKTLFITGGGLLLISILARSIKMLKTAAKSGVSGYHDGKNNDT